MKLKIVKCKAITVLKEYIGGNLLAHDLLKSSLFGTKSTIHKRKKIHRVYFII